MYQSGTISTQKIRWVLSISTLLQFIRFQAPTCPQLSSDLRLKDRPMNYQTLLPMRKSISFFSPKFLDSRWNERIERSASLFVLVDGTTTPIQHYFPAAPEIDSPFLNSINIVCFGEGKAEVSCLIIESEVVFSWQQTQAGFENNSKKRNEIFRRGKSMRLWIGDKSRKHTRSSLFVDRSFLSGRIRRDVLLALSKLLLDGNYFAFIAGAIQNSYLPSFSTKERQQVPS